METNTLPLRQYAEKCKSCPGKVCSNSDTLSDISHSSFDIFAFWNVAVVREKKNLRYFREYEKSRLYSFASFHSQSIIKE